ncbi:MAG: zinc ribbon domain-containing protein, partial [Ignavibacteriae bacterium]|nr:zinc ribbon domain-containing protein [Ignavibacteriota bacterium]
MLCANCGSEIAYGTKFCPTCGSAVQQSPDEPQPLTRKRERSISRYVAFILFPLAAIIGAGVFIRYINPSVHQVIKDQPVVSAPQDYDSTMIT